MENKHDNECSICKEQISIPHILPCNHIHCLLCITRHLHERNFCPICYRHPLHVTDLKSVSEEYQNMLPEIKTFFIYRNKDSVITKELKRYNLRLDGSLDRKKWRLKEFYLLYSIEKRKKLPKSMTGIVRTVHHNEQLFFEPKKSWKNETYKNKIKENFRKIKLLMTER
ncbi:Postreplication repair E3 ubiquitin-protein ligase RAD18 [Astathelohania contejeani]|uniref:Postreplication repair E3 ubiquitin-protein ligase RAD18 n=1 Tax=Astathelohania contejeani TaxID=164912 RepID=A0ABQ7I307_9MICR|nr:Postreplication repair E3 ubiquitin-protein ligase RAD18 [Thelohania contejeani]